MRRFLAFRSYRAQDILRRRSLRQARLGIADRVLLALLRVLWIGFVWGGVVVLRATALAIHQPAAHQPKPPAFVGEWQEIRYAGRSLTFTQDGKYQKALDGKVIESGNYFGTEDDLQIVGLGDADGRPIRGVKNHSEAELHEVRLRLDRDKNRLVVVRRREEWRYPDRDPYVESWQHHLVYKRRPVGKP